MSDGPRILTLNWADAHEQSSLSGMPWNMKRALRTAGCDVVSVRIGNLQNSTMRQARRAVRRHGLFRNLKSRLQGIHENIFSGHVGRVLERHAVRAAAIADEAVRSHAPDAVFGPCMSRPIGFMETDRPIVYASDATASLLLDTYDIYRHRGSGWRDAMVSFETRAIARADRIALASDRTARSAIEDHGADPDRVSVVPMGANISMPEGDAVDIPAAAPGVDDLRLLLVAADPERKRLDLCTRIARELRGRGWHATLHYVGPYRPLCEDEVVDWAGRLRLGDPADRRIHLQLLRDAHVGILPSLAEMFGIAPIESAAFGRPSVVSDVGGLPTVVRDGCTGRVVPPDATTAIWCDAIEAMVSRPDRYAEFSRQARHRHETELNWSAWGRTMRGLIEQVV